MVKKIAINSTGQELSYMMLVGFVLLNSDTNYRQTSIKLKLLKMIFLSNSLTYWRPHFCCQCSRLLKYSALLVSLRTWLCEII